MGIDVRVERSDRTPVGPAPLSDAEGELARLIREEAGRGRERFPLVTSIDPYGDTLVNYLMAPLLCAEIKELAATSGDPTGMLGAVTEMAEFVSQHEAERLFLAFIGD